MVKTQRIICPAYLRINLNFKDPVRTAPWTLSISVTVAAQLLQYGEIISVYFEIYRAHKYIVWAELRIF